jgi:hypothetical protein
MWSEETLCLISDKAVETGTSNEWNSFHCWIMSNLTLWVCLGTIFGLAADPCVAFHSIHAR